MPVRIHDDRTALKLFSRCALCLALAVLVLAPGCVRRRLLVRSNPPGATVYVDNQPIGVTPCATSFIYYGTREVRLVKPGYETLTVNQPIPAPWYEAPGIDFVSENVFPKEIQDYRTVSFTLTPQVMAPTEQLLARAQALRSGTQQGIALPPGAAADQPYLAPNFGPPLVPSTGPIGGATTGPMLAPPTGSETLAPGVALPSTGGAGALPRNGVPLEPLPPPK